MKHPHLLQATEEQQGFSLPLAIVTGLILLLGGIALANRVGLSVVGAVFQGQGLGARSAAEAGATRIIGELNEPPNRRFLLSNTATTSDNLWGTSEFAANSVLASTCTPLGQTLSSNWQLGTTGTPPTTGPYPWVYINSNGRVVSQATNATQAYRLVSIRRQPLSTYNISTDLGFGRFTLVVDGATVRNGTLTSQVRLEKDYQVMPKCCDLSFGGEHGRVPYEYGTSGKYDCLRNVLGFGLVGGAAANNTGTVILRGNTDAFDSDGDPVPIIYCVVNRAVAGTCTPTDNAQNLSVRNVVTDMPSVPLPPAPLAAELSAGARLTQTAIDRAPTLQGASGSDLCGSSSPTSFCRRVGSGASETLVIDGGVSRADITNNVGGIRDFCTLVPTGATSTNGKAATKEELHCVIRRLEFTNSSTRNVRIATGNRAVRLYFINPDASSNTPIIEGSGNSTLSVCTTASGTCQSPDDMTDASLLGCPSPVQTFKLLNPDGTTRTCSPQTVRMGGTPAAGNGGGLFLWFPNGNVDLVGTSGFTGVAWANTISATGTVDFIVPGSGLGNVLRYSGFIDSTAGGNNGNAIPFPFIDFIARATSKFQWCSVSPNQTRCSN